MSKLIDANIILRYLVGDSPEQVKKVKKLVKEEKEKYLITDVTIAETVWVLESYYDQTREQITEKIIGLLEVPVFLTNKSLITRAINYYNDYSIDYIDAYLVAFAEENGQDGIVSFDKSIDKAKKGFRFEP